MLLVGTHLGLLATFDLANHLLGFLTLFGISFASLWLAERQLRSGGLGLTPLLVVAALLRLTLLPLPPTLSNDVLRYVWDGRVVVAGSNPYLHAPNSAELEPLRDELWEQMDHREVPTVYPPFAMALFTVAAALPCSSVWQVFSLKFLLCIADLFTCAGLVYLARRLRLRESCVLWYAWNPLVVLEVAGMGHVDALGVAAVVAAVVFLPKRIWLAALAATASIQTKLVPLLLAPMWGRQSQRPMLFLAFLTVLSVMVTAPILWLTGGIPPGLVAYGVSWEFNGPLFEPLWRILQFLETPDRVEGLLNSLKEASDNHPAWNRLYPFNYPQLHAKLLLGLGLLAAVGRSWWLRSSVAGTGWFFGTLLLFSATVYPWYLLWALPWAALCRQRAWIGLSALLPLSYLSQFSDLPHLPWIFAAIWLPFAVLLWRYPRWSTD